MPNPAAPAAPVEATATADTVEQALARWQAAAAGQPGERGLALAKLAAFDDPRVTAILVDELAQARPGPLLDRAVSALGQRPRASALEPLRELLRRPLLSAALRNGCAVAIARQGNRGIDLLIELARADGERAEDAVRVAAANALAAVGDERAWRGLAPLALRGPVPERLAVLRLLEPARDVAAVTQARLRLLQDSDSQLAATAWRQLAQEGHPRARAGFEDLVERLGNALAVPVRVELVHGLGAGLWPDVHSTFVRLAADPAPALQVALRKVAPVLAQDAAFVRFLLTEVLRSEDEAERQVAVAIVAKAAPALVQPLLDGVRAGLQRPTKASIDAALALSALLAKDARWPDDVKRLLSATDPEVRTTGFQLLFDLGDGGAIELAQRNLAAKEWELRSVACRYLTRFRALSSIPLLIARTDKEDGRLAAEVGDALFALTGTRCWSRGEWDAWWRKHKDGHQLPAAATIATATQKSGGGTVAYYGIPLTSKRTIFLLDVSGSMLARVGTDKKRTRLDEARRQLQRVVGELPDDQWFNLVSYEGGVTPVWDAMHKATAAEKQHVLDLLQKLTAGRGGTNIHDALELAFRDPDVDTVYLLSDGEPTAGRIVDPDDLADAVRRWNYGRQIVVHCVSIGTDSVLLQRLAKESGGQYVLAR